MISRKVDRGQGIEDRGKRIGSMSFLRKQESSPFCHSCGSRNPEKGKIKIKNEDFCCSKNS